MFNDQTRINRNQIYEALASYLQTNLTSVKKVDRQLKDFNKVNASDCPILFCVQSKEQCDTTTKMMTKWIFSVDLILYINQGSKTIQTPYLIANDIVDEICFLFSSQRNFETDGRQTLNGLVHTCKLSGQIDF